MNGKLATLQENAAAQLPQVRCPHCNKRLFDGFMVGVIMCPRARCKRLVRFLAKEHGEAYSQANDKAIQIVSAG